MKKPILCITFDDGYNTDFSVAYSEMRKRGLKGTSYIITSNFINEANIRSFTKIKDYTKMRANGWDVQDHLNENYRLDELTLQEQIDEFDLATTRFHSIGFNPSHTAYPGGNYNADTLTAISTRRKTGRGTVYGLNTYETINWYAMLNIPGDMNSMSALDSVKSQIDTTIENNQIMIINFHDLDGATIIRQGFFIDFLNYVVKKNISVMTIDEMYHYVNDNV